MNKEETYNELKNKIIKYVPEILILCRYCGGSGMNYFINPENGEQEREYCSDCQGCGYEGERPITLEDVLIALRESQTNHIYTIDIFGNWECEKGLLKSEYNWDLGKQLHEQSEETITALNKLIK